MDIPTNTYTCTYVLMYVCIKAFMAQSVPARVVVALPILSQVYEPCDIVTILLKRNRKHRDILWYAWQLGEMEFSR